MRNRKSFWLIDGWVVFPHSKNSSGCSLLEPKNPLGLSSLADTRTGTGWGAVCLGCPSVWQGEGAHTEGAAVPRTVPSLLLSASLAAMPMIQKNHTITPTSEYALTAATMKSLWKCWTEYFSILWGKIGGFIIFFPLYLLWLVLFHFWCQIRRNF